MLSDTYLLLFNLATNSTVLIFLGFYYYKLRKREKVIEKKEKKVDQEYHEVVDDALSKERKILDDAAHAADQIMTGAQYVKKETKAEVYYAMQKMAADIHKDAQKTAEDFINEFRTSLNQLAAKSIGEYQGTYNQLSDDMQRQLKEFAQLTEGIQTEMQAKIKDFQEKRLQLLEKEIEDYKQARMKEVSDSVSLIVNEASQEIFNKAISMDDHHALLIEAMEKAKAKGMFE